MISDNNEKEKINYKNNNNKTTRLIIQSLKIISIPCQRVITV